MTEDGLKLVGEFIEILGADYTPEAAYRGHGDFNWQMLPTVNRVDQGGITTSDRLQEWKRRAAPFAEPRPQTEIEWLALAQHYRIATPLLDWSVSPLVALYFAAQVPIDLDGKPMSVDGAVYRLKLGLLDRLNHTLFVDPFAESEQRPKIVDFRHLNARAHAQDSLMTIHALNPREGSEMPRNRFEEIFRVPSASKSGVKAALEALGLSADRIYSDIGETARNFASEF